MLSWQEGKNRIFLKIAALVVLQAFFISNIGYTAPSDRSLFKGKRPNYGAIQEQREKDLQQKKDVLAGKKSAKESLYKKDVSHRLNLSSLNDLSSIYIPDSLGRVTEVYQAPGVRGPEQKPLVVHIQDLHTNPEAQFNSAAILETLIKNYGLDLVCSEGAEGEVDTTSVSSFPDAEVREKTARLFVNSGELTGEEYLSITKYPDLPIWGIEDRDIYFENIIEFNKIMKFSPASLALIGQIKEALGKLKPKIYSANLLEIDENERRYEENEIETRDYIEYLIGLDPSFDTKGRFKNISIFLESLEFEKDIDQEKIMRQSQNLLSGLQDALSKNRGKEMTDLVAKAELFKDKKISAFSFYSYLDELARTHLQDDIDKYKNLFQFVDYLTKVNSLDSVKLFNEIEDLTYALKESFSTNEDQRLLAKSLRHIKILEDFFNLKLSNEELDYYLTDREGHKVGFFEAFLKENLARYNIETFIDFNSELIDYRLEELEHFYDIAKERDIAMCNNVLQEIERRNAKVAAFITGGFHTRGITQFLKEKGYSYAVIAPYSSTEIDEENYRTLLSGKRKPISELIDELNDMLRPILTMSSSEFKREAARLGIFPDESDGLDWPRLSVEDEQVEKAKIKKITDYLGLYFNKEEYDGETVDILKRASLFMNDIENLYGGEYRIRIALGSQETREIADGYELAFLFRRIKDDREFCFYYRIIDGIVEKLTAEEYQWQIADKMREYYEKMYFPEHPSGNIRIVRRSISLKQCSFANNVSRWRTEFKKLRIKHKNINPAVIIKDPTRGGSYIVAEGCHRSMAKLETSVGPDPKIDAWVLEFRTRSERFPISFQNQLKAIPISQFNVTNQIPPLFDLISEGMLDRVSPQERADKLFSIILPAGEAIIGYIPNLQQIVDMHKGNYIGITAQAMIDKIRKVGKESRKINEEDWLAILSAHGLQPVNIEHSRRNVIKIIDFLEREGLSEEETGILKAALWLHDITKDMPWEDYIPEDKGLANTFRLLIHHLEGAELAEVILKEQGRGDDFINQVKNIILRHMGPIKGTFIFEGSEYGFMEYTRLKNLESIKKVLESSAIDKERKEKLNAYLDKLEQGFPEPETRLEKIARDIDLLDLAAEGVTKVVESRQTDQSFFDNETKTPETVKESFYSAMRSAGDTRLNLYTNAAIEKIEGLLADLRDFERFMVHNGFFDLIEKVLPVKGDALEKDLRKRAEIFKGLYDYYTEKHRFYLMTHNPGLGIINDPDFIEALKQDPSDNICSVPVTPEIYKERYRLLPAGKQKEMSEEEWTQLMGHRQIVVFNRRDIEKRYPGLDYHAICKFTEMALFHELVHHVVDDLEKGIRRQYGDNLGSLKEFLGRPKFKPLVNKKLEAVLRNGNLAMTEFVAYWLGLKEYNGISIEPDIKRNIEELANSKDGRQFCGFIADLHVHEITKRRLEPVLRGINGQLESKLSSIKNVLAAKNTVRFLFDADHYHPEELREKAREMARNVDFLFLEIKEKDAEIFNKVSSGKIDPEAGFLELKNLYSDKRFYLEGHAKMLLESVYNTSVIIMPEGTLDREEYQRLEETTFRLYQKSIIQFIKGDLRDAIIERLAYFKLKKTLLNTRDKVLEKNIERQKVEYPNKRIGVIAGAMHTPVFISLSNEMRQRGWAVPDRTFSDRVIYDPTDIFIRQLQLGRKKLSDYSDEEKKAYILKTIVMDVLFNGLGAEGSRESGKTYRAIAERLTPEDLHNLAEIGSFDSDIDLSSIVKRYIVYLKAKGKITEAELGSLEAAIGQAAGIREGISRSGPAANIIEGAGVIEGRLVTFHERIEIIENNLRNFLQKRGIDINNIDPRELTKLAGRIYIAQNKAADREFVEVDLEDINIPGIISDDSRVLGNLGIGGVVSEEVLRKGPYRKDLASRVKRGIGPFTRDRLITGLLVSLSLSLLPLQGEASHGPAIGSLTESVTVSSSAQEEYEQWLKTTSSLVSSDYTERGIEEAGDLGTILSWNIKTEKPTKYQLQQIKTMRDEIVKETEQKLFPSTIDLLEFINSSIDSNLADDKNTIYLKDAFPETEGGKAKGTFDCDSRAVMCEAVLQALGYNSNDVTMCALEGHMILWVRNENKFFELVTNEARELSEEEELQLNIIDSHNRYLSHFLSNEATNLGLESNRRRGQLLSTDKEKIEMAIKKCQEALELDPQNITAQLNLIQLLEQKLTGKERRTVLEQIKKVYYNLFSNLSKRFNEMAEGKEIRLDTGETPNMYIASKIFDYAGFLCFDAKDYEGAIEAWQTGLNKAGNDLNENEIKNIKISIAKAYFLAGDYEEFIEQAPGIIFEISASPYFRGDVSGLEAKLLGPSFRENVSKLQAMLLAAKIISGEIKISESNAGDFCKKYRDDPFLGPFISGEQSEYRYVYAVETLEKWDGFNQMMDLVEKYRNRTVPDSDTRKLKDALNLLSKCETKEEYLKAWKTIHKMDLSDDERERIYKSSYWYDYLQKIALPPLPKGKSPTQGHSRELEYDKKRFDEGEIGIGEYMIDVLNAYNQLLTEQNIEAILMNTEYLEPLEDWMNENREIFNAAVDTMNKFLGIEFASYLKKGEKPITVEKAIGYSSGSNPSGGDLFGEYKNEIVNIDVNPSMLHNFYSMLKTLLHEYSHGVETKKTLPTLPEGYREELAWKYRPSEMYADIAAILLYRQLMNEPNAYKTTLEQWKERAPKIRKKLDRLLEIKSKEKDTSLELNAHFEALPLKGERNPINAGKEIKKRPEEKRIAVPNVDIKNTQGEDVFEMTKGELGELTTALGMSEGEIGAFIHKAFSTLERWGIDTSRIRDKKILIALLEKEASQHLFEDCQENDFIGINRTFLNIARTNPGLARILFIVGLAHELRHEAGRKEEDIRLDAALAYELMQEEKIGIDELSKVLEDYLDNDEFVNAVKEKGRDDIAYVGGEISKAGPLMAQTKTSTAKMTRRRFVKTGVILATAAFAGKLIYDSAEPSKEEKENQNRLIEPIHKETYNSRADFEGEKEYLIASRNTRNNLLGRGDTEKVKAFLTPARIKSIRFAADTWNLEPELIAGFLYEEKTDKDAKNSMKKGIKEFVSRLFGFYDMKNTAGLGNVSASFITDRDFLDLLYENREFIFSLLETEKDISIFERFIDPAEGYGFIKNFPRRNSGVYKAWLKTIYGVLNSLVEIEPVNILLCAYSMRISADRIVKRNRREKRLPDISVMAGNSRSWLVKDYKEIPVDLKERYGVIFNSSYFPPYAYQYFSAADYTGAINSTTGKKRSLAKVKAYMMLLRSAVFKSQDARETQTAADKSDGERPRGNWMHVKQAGVMTAALSDAGDFPSDGLSQVQEAAKDAAKKIRPKIERMKEIVEGIGDERGGNHNREGFEEIDKLSDEIARLMRQYPSIPLLHQALEHEISQPLYFIKSSAELALPSSMDIGIEKRILMIKNNIARIEQQLFYLENMKILCLTEGMPGVPMLDLEASSREEATDSMDELNRVQEKTVNVEVQDVTVEIEAAYEGAFGRLIDKELLAIFVGAVDDEEFTISKLSELFKDYALSGRTIDLYEAWNIVDECLGRAIPLTPEEVMERLLKKMAVFKITQEMLLAPIPKAGDKAIIFGNDLPLFSTALALMGVDVTFIDINIVMIELEKDFVNLYQKQIERSGGKVEFVQFDANDVDTQHGYRERSYDIIFVDNFFGGFGIAGDKTISAVQPIKIYPDRVIKNAITLAKDGGRIWVNTIDPSTKISSEELLIKITEENAIGCSRISKYMERPNFGTDAVVYAIQKKEISDGSPAEAISVPQELRSLEKLRQNL